jgi:predicted phosphodiesterase
MARTILVGDVHGCADEFGDLLDRVGYAQGVDALVLVGDLVARGPDSGRAVARAMEAGARAVRGNHDEKVLTWWRLARIRGPAVADAMVRLGEKHRRAVAQLADEHFAYLEAQPLTLALPEHDVLVVHAGLDPATPLEAQDPHLLMNIRSLDDEGRGTRQLTSRPWARAWTGPIHVVFGHDARRGLQFEPFATGLDSGCCYGRALTALVLDAGEPVPADVEARRRSLVSVPARAVHCPMGDGSGPE